MTRSVRMLPPLSSGALAPRSRAQLALLAAALSVSSAATGDDSSGDGVVLLPYDAGGNALGDPIQANVDPFGSQSSRGVAIAKDGTIVVIWDDSQEQRVEARLFRSNGEPAGGELVVADLAASVSGARLDVAPDGGFVVAWSDGELFVREFDRTGRPASEIAPVNSTITGLQRSPDVGAGAGRLVVVQESDGQDGDNFGVFGQTFERRSIFADGFESGKLSAWSAVVAAPPT